MRAYLIYPHQLYNPQKVCDLLMHFSQISLAEIDCIIFAESHLYFKQYHFHPLKIRFHQDSMQLHLKEWQAFIDVNFKNIKKNINNIKDNNNRPELLYIKQEELNDKKSSDLFEIIAKKGIKHIYTCDPTDDWLSQQTQQETQKANITLSCFPSPNFIFSLNQLKTFFAPYLEKFANQGFKAHQNLLLMQSFYIFSRKQLNILIDESENINININKNLVNKKNNTQKPLGGKWSFDQDNRKKIPKELIPNLPNDPPLANFAWPASREAAEKTLQNFLTHKFSQFGDYEDAIIHDKTFLYHSSISPYLNIGLLEPLDVVKTAIEYGIKHNISLASIEGFVRQIIGWREYMRAIYCLFGRQIRQQNFFEFDKTLSSDYWSASTGNLLIDQTIQKTLNYAYNHHIERLMVLGNYMLLKRTHPNAVYEWFMQMYIDAYDWVMVPNIYSMSQYADGGLVTSKPYICGSNYILKMSNYSKTQVENQAWQQDFDQSYWQFLRDNQSKLANNPRMRLMLSKV